MRVNPDPAAPTLDDGLQQRIVQSLDDGLYYVDRERRILYWTGGAERISGYAAAEIVGQHCYDNRLNHVDENGQSLCHGKCPLAATIEDGQRRESVVYLRHREGHRVPVRVRTSPVYDDAGAIVGAAEVFTDQAPLPASRTDVDELRRLAFDDQLTGLPNRTHAERVLNGRIASLERRGWPFGLLIADIDRFKDVNDEHGHLAGDAVLRVVARTIANASRPEDFVARWAGDEFVVVVTAADAGGLMSVANRMRALVARSRPGIDGDKVAISISIGATSAVEGDTIDTLFARADRALYAAKEAGRNRAFLQGPEDSPALAS